MSKSFKHDLTGQRFGRLTVLEFVPNDKHGSYWKCQCDCGNTIIAYKENLDKGRSQSCGCLHSERLTQRNTKHGCKGTRLYHIWEQMKARCFNFNNPRYKDYGGRGITVCDKWKNDFQPFYDWAMSNGYRDDLSIDRIDNNGNYEPDNCRWVDSKTQNRNTRRNVFVEHNGEKICFTDAAKRSNIKWHTLWKRYRQGDRGDRLFRPVRPHK